MTFNKDILRIADGIIDTLKNNEFFEDHPFVGEPELTKLLKEKMQTKWETEGEMLLTDKEFMETCNEVMHESVGNTIEGLLDKGALQMSIGEGGEIYYSANPDFDMDKIFEDEEE
jgi:hypothetical protein